jgi:glycosyltransferase involved in cell wall biosynthesis
MDGGFGAGPRISLIVPAFNERELLPRLLDSVETARLRFRGGAGAVEVIVADNDSTDDTAGVAARRGCRVVTIGERRIACVRNAGAAAAGGEVLCFVDADGQIHPESFNVVSDALSDPGIIGGASGVRLERWSLGIGVTYALFMPWVWLLRMDTGLVFVRSADFEAVGGYDERRTVGEDVHLLFALRRLGRRRGQRLVRLTAIKGVASMRKFDEHGDWHVLTDLLRLLPTVLGPPGRSHVMVEKYWYGDQRRPGRGE